MIISLIEIISLIDSDREALERVRYNRLKTK